MSKFRSMVDALKAPGKAIEKAIGGPFHALEKEAKLGPVLHAEVMAALRELQEKHPEVKKMLQDAWGFAVIPSIGRASAVLGGAYGVGEVFEQQKVIGYAAIIELTVGIQLGGVTFHELVVFHDEGSLKRFKAGKFALAADAGVAIVKAGAQALHGFGASSSIFQFTEGGMLLDLGIGGQKFSFKPAALGRFRTTEGVVEGEPPPSGEEERAEEARGEQEQEQPPQPEEHHPA